MYFSFQGKSINSNPKVSKSFEKIHFQKAKYWERDRQVAVVERMSRIGRGGQGGEGREVNEESRVKGWRKRRGGQEWVTRELSTLMLNLLLGLNTIESGVCLFQPKSNTYMFCYFFICFPNCLESQWSKPVSDATSAKIKNQNLNIVLNFIPSWHPLTSWKLGCAEDFE